MLLQFLHNTVCCCYIYVRCDRRVVEEWNSLNILNMTGMTNCHNIWNHNVHFVAADEGIVRLLSLGGTTSKAQWVWNKLELIAINPSKSNQRQANMETFRNTWTAPRTLLACRTISNDIRTILWSKFCFLLQGEYEYSLLVSNIINILHWRRRKQTITIKRASCQKQLQWLD